MYFKKNLTILKIVSEVSLFYFTWWLTVLVSYFVHSLLFVFYSSFCLVGVLCHTMSWNVKTLSKKELWMYPKLFYFNNVSHKFYKLKSKYKKGKVFGVQFIYGLRSINHVVPISGQKQEEQLVKVKNNDNIHYI